MPTDQQLMKLFQDLLEQSSLERQAQTKAFQESLDKLRTDMRVFNTLTLLVVCALEGLNIYFRKGDLQITQPASTATVDADRQGD